MRIKIVPFIISFFFSVLLGYAFFAVSKNYVHFLISGITLLMILESGFGFDYSVNGTFNVKVSSFCFAMVNVVVNLIFVFIFKHTIPAYIIVSGLVLLIDIGITYSIITALK